MVSSGVLDDETLVALHSLEDGGLLDGPLPNIGPFLALLVGSGRALLRVRGLPSLLPVVGELLKEVGLDGGGLQNRLSAFQLIAAHAHESSDGCRELQEARPG